MDEKDLQFLENESKIWDATEDEQMQKQAISVIQRYTHVYFDRMKNPNFDPNTKKEFDENLDLLDVLEIGEDKCSLEKLISVFDKDIVQSAAIDFAKPTFFGLIPGSGNLLYTIAEYLSSLTHVMPLGHFVNSGACEIEESVIKWVCGVVGYPDTATGVTVSGTSMGAVIAFATARDHLLPSLNNNNADKTPVIYIPEHAHGYVVSDFSKIEKRPVIYIPEHAHGCNIRDLRVVGLGNCRYHRVPALNCRMAADSLDAMILKDKKQGYFPFLLIATMGSTATGAIDPLEELAEITRKHNVWFHVDASYGGFLLLDDVVRSRCRGIDMADSITLDFHKGLSAPCGHAVILCRDRRHLQSSMSRHENPFLPAGELRYSPLELSFEYTRPFRAFPIWFLLKTVGTAAVTSQMSEKIKLTEYAYTTLSQMNNVSVYMKPDLTIIAFRYDPPDNDVTRKWLQLLKEEAVICVTETIENELLYIRLCILSFRTHLDSVETALSSIQRNLLKAHSSCILN